MSPSRVRAIIAILLSGGAALWFAHGIEWGALGEVLGQVRLPWLAAAASILVGEFVLRAWRWKVLLRPLGMDTRVGDLFAAQVIGAAANTLFPLRAGEIAKPLVASRRTGHPFVAVVATTVMERVYDLFGMITILVLMALVLPDTPSTETELVTNLKLYGGFFGAFAFSCMVTFFILATREQAARSVFVGLVRLAPAPLRNKLLALFDGFVAGLGNARDLKGLIQAGVLSVWMWFDGALAIWFLFRGFGMDLPFGAACFVGVAIALTVALPQAPGFIGVFHVAMEKTMLLWGQDPAYAQGFALVFWAVSFLPVTAIGLAAMWREGLDPGTIRSWTPEGAEVTPANR